MSQMMPESALNSIISRKHQFRYNIAAHSLS